MKKRLNKLEKEYIEYPETCTPGKRSKFNNSVSSYVYRKLKHQIFACVEYVIRKSMLDYEPDGKFKIGPEGKQARMFLIKCYTKAKLDIGLF